MIYFHLKQTNTYLEQFYKKCGEFEQFQPIFS